METESSRHHAAFIVSLTAGVGLLAGLAAATGSGPFAAPATQRPSIRLVSHHKAAGPPVTPLDAGALFPPPITPVVHRAVVIYDPPPPVAVVPQAAAPLVSRVAPTLHVVAPQPAQPAAEAAPAGPAQIVPPQGSGDDNGGGDNGN